MKKVFSLLASLLCVMVALGQVKEGKVTFNMQFNSDDPQVQSQIGILQGSKMIMYFSPEFNRVELSMGGMMEVTTIADVKSKESLVLMGGMMGQKAIKMNADDLKNIDVKKPAIKKTGETKTIAGYKCVKYIVTTDETVVNIWTTNDLIAAKDGMQYVNEEIPGFPLEFEASVMGMSLVGTASEVQKGLGKSNKKELFSMAIPSGYEEMSADDLNEMGGR
ncbi:MAG: hypothetical protein BGO09_15810 [Bacteroidetes bacterium 47-18]|nr:MAG: hypothetical protein BGO09_15810 [Bacteroidetes bacterium 47-18]